MAQNYCKMRESENECICIIIYKHINKYKYLKINSTIRISKRRMKSCGRNRIKDELGSKIAEKAIKILVAFGRNVPVFFFLFLFHVFFLSRLLGKIENLIERIQKFAVKTKSHL